MWRDLVPVTRLEILAELLLPLPWLVASLAMAWNGNYFIALGFSFIFFLRNIPCVRTLDFIANTNAPRA